MDKRGLIKIIVIVGALLVVGFFWFVGQMNGEEEIKCVPASCCHSVKCVLESEAPNCSGRVCSMVCEPETLDCGQGKCEFIDGACEVVWNE